MEHHAAAGVWKLSIRLKGDCSIRQVVDAKNKGLPWYGAALFVQLYPRPCKPGLRCNAAVIGSGTVF
ncbi:hypothetical protein L21SP2_1115 [Salinispira pacifica]|uniref:Uncharacterized protein n=1 Tax=Salinispira pacifica TaxID=1307761 RepID=V5WFY8_9SPIO|nr:hypothetical protein L21SP2_1115 [Salinispira pacifica]